MWFNVQRFSYHFPGKLKASYMLLLYNNTHWQPSTLPFSRKQRRWPCGRLEGAEYWDDVEDTDELKDSLFFECDSLSDNSPCTIGKLILFFVVAFWCVSRYSYLKVFYKLLLSMLKYWHDLGLWHEHFNTSGEINTFFLVHV